MKKILLGILLPVLTLITLIGTGFATWYFNDDLSATKSVTTNVEVTSVAKIGTIEIINKDAKLQLDQPVYGKSTGIELLDNSGVNPVTMFIKYVPPVTSTGEVAVAKVRMEARVYFSYDQRQYLRMQGAWQNGSYGAYFFCFINVDGNKEASITLNNYDFMYLNEPKNLDEYQAMKRAFQNPIKIEVTASYV